MSHVANNGFRSGLLGKFSQVPTDGGTKMRPVVVVGGGISGLLMAYGLMRKGCDVKLFEATNRVGGVLHTATTPYGLAETAAHSFLLTENVEKLLTELGLKPLMPNPQGRARYIFKNAKMRRLPLGLIDIFVALWRMFTVPVRQDDLASITVQQFADRHLGQGVRRFLLTPALSGIYAGDTSRMSAAAVFSFLQPAAHHDNNNGSLFAVLRRARSSQKKSRGMATLPGGMKDLVDALTSALGSRIVLNTPVNDLAQFSPDYDVVLACGPRPAAKLLSPPKEAEVRIRTSAGLESAPDELIKSLESVEMLPLITATVFYNRTDLKKFKPGVGVLMVQDVFSKRGVRALGILFNSSAFMGRAAYLGRAHPPTSPESFTVMYGGALDKDALNLTDEELAATIQQDFSMVLGAQDKPLHVQITRWAGVLPHHTAELCGLWAEANELLPPGVLLFGNYTGQISLRGLIETVARALPSA